MRVIDVRHLYDGKLHSPAQRPSNVTVEQQAAPQGHGLEHVIREEIRFHLLLQHLALQFAPDVVGDDGGGGGRGDDDAVRGWLVTDDDAITDVLLLHSDGTSSSSSDEFPGFRCCGNLQIQQTLTRWSDQRLQSSNRCLPQPQPVRMLPSHKQYEQVGRRRAVTYSFVTSSSSLDDSVDHLVTVARRRWQEHDHLHLQI